MRVRDRNRVGIAGIEHRLQRVYGAGADVAEHDTQGGDGHAQPQCLGTGRLLHTWDNTAVVFVAAVLIVLPALGVVGTFLHGVPYVGLATAYVLGYLPWLLVVAGLGGALALFSWTRRRGRIAAALVVVSLLTIVGGSVVNARMTAAVEHAGADIDFIETFGVGQPKSARPDAEATYTNFDGVPLQLSIYAPARSSRGLPRTRPRLHPRRRMGRR